MLEEVAGEYSSSDVGDDSSDLLSEAEFLVGILRRHQLVDDSTITAIRRQYAHVLSLASPEARSEGRQISVRLVFERLDPREHL